MTNEKAIGLLNEQKGYNRKMATAWAKSSWAPEPGEVCGAALLAQRYKDMADALELALSALSAAPAAPVVQPLTLAELGQMDGQPVYIQVLQTGEGRWGLLESVGECVVGVLMPDGKKSYHLRDLYHKTWTAYAYPPPVHIDRETWEPCVSCKDGNIKVNVPEFRAMAICNQHMDHEAFTLTMRALFCPVCGRPLTPEAWAELEKHIEKVKI